MQIKKTRKTEAAPVEAMKQTAEERLAWAAGAQQFRHRDPLYHVAENFQQTFDRIGQSHAAAAAGGFSEEQQTTAEPAKRGLLQGGMLQVGTLLGGMQRQFQTPTLPRQKVKGVLSGIATRRSVKESPRQQSGGMLKGAREEQADTDGDLSTALTSFSDTVFQRGMLYGAVLNGTGKMLLVSCLRRTVGESGPKRVHQESFLSPGSQLRNLPGRSPDQMAFNRTFSKSALGIVVDTLRDARRVVGSMEDMARGTGELENENSETLRKMYPFLDDSRDAALEAEYREKLKSCTDEREKPILQNALVQTLSLRAKKAQMKNEFINKLRFLSDRATETLSELETPGILDELVTAAFGAQEPNLPENPEEGAGDDAPGRPKNRRNTAAGKANGAGPAKQAP